MSEFAGIMNNIYGETSSERGSIFPLPVNRKIAISSIFSALENLYSTMQLNCNLHHIY
jgi:hypothetical protein